MSKIVFVNAFEYNYIGTRLLASYLRKNGHQTHNILLGDSGFRNITRLQDTHLGYIMFRSNKIVSHVGNKYPLVEEDFKALECVLREERPDIIGFSARSTNNYLVPILVPVFRRAMPDALLVAGGYGPTLDPEIYLDGGFDAVVRGDGEEAMLELAECRDKGDQEAAVQIANTWWAASLGGTRNAMRDQEKDLRKYPPQLYGHEGFTTISRGCVQRRFDPVMDANAYFTFLGRGCTGTCTYCSGGQWRTLYRSEGKKAYPRRNRSIHDVIEECEKIPQNMRYITFTDEFWSLPADKTREFFSLYRDRIGKPFWVFLHYEQMLKHRDIFDLVLDAGLVATGVGFQSGSGSFLQKYYNRKPEYDVLLEYAQILFNNFILTDALFIGGNCYETMEDFHEALELVRKLPFNIEIIRQLNIQVTRLKAHPHTPLTLIAPRVVTDPMPANEWLYRALLMNLANKMPPEDLREIMSASLFRRDAMLLYSFSQSWISSQETRHFERLVDEGEGRDWVFYGAGENYQRNKAFFSRLRPRCILVDRAYLPEEKTVDGIPVTATEDFFADRQCESETRFLVLIQPVTLFAKKLLRTYGVPYENIHACEICMTNDTDY